MEFCNYLPQETKEIRQQRGWGGWRDLNQKPGFIFWMRKFTVFRPRPKGIGCLEVKLKNANFLKLVPWKELLLRPTFGLWTAFLFKIKKKSVLPVRPTDLAAGQWAVTILPARFQVTECTQAV